MPKRQKKSHPARVSTGNRKRTGKTIRKSIVVVKARNRYHPYLAHVPKSSPVFARWLAAAVKDPFDVKPPAIGAHGAPTSIIKFVSRTILNTNAYGSLRFAFHPTASPFFYSGADPTGNGAAIIVAATGMSTVSTFFGSARPICGGIRFTSVNPSTAVPGYWSGMQQAGGFPTSSWLAATGTFSPTAVLTSACPDPPSPMAAGRWEYMHWKHEDPADYNFEPNDIAVTAPPTRPLLVGAISGASTSGVSWIFETICWAEVKYISSAATIFGKDASTSIDEQKGQQVIDHTEEKTATNSASSLNDYINVGASVVSALASNPYTPAVGSLVKLGHQLARVG